MMIDSDDAFAGAPVPPSLGKNSQHKRGPKFLLNEDVLGEDNGSGGSDGGPVKFEPPRVPTGGSKSSFNFPGAS
jgi:hypothetical protein